MTEEKIIGILADVSGSMKEKFKTNLGLNDHDTSRIQSVIKTICEIFKKESELNAGTKVFSLAFGLLSKVDVCDLVALVEFAANLKDNLDILNGKRNLDLLLKSRGAPNAEEFIDQHLTDEECAFLYALSRLPRSAHTVRQVIASLPSACFPVRNEHPLYIWLFGVALFPPVVLVLSGERLIRYGRAVPGSRIVYSPIEGKKTKEVAKNAKEKFITTKLKECENPNIYELRNAISILENALDDGERSESLNNEKMDVIIKHLEPFIYGWTPMKKALEQTETLFNGNYKNKILFLITDGESKDGNPASLAQIFKNLDVTVIVCFMTADHSRNPRKLYYTAQNGWSKGELQMFELATAIDNERQMMSALLERGWTLAVEGQSKLFFRVNHPDLISEIGDIISEKNCDSILNIISRAQLDKFIESNTKTVYKQNGGTCYAHACAYAIYSAEMRIYAREGGVVPFDVISSAMIDKYKSNGAFCHLVLEEFCEIYRLRYRKVCENQARIAISQRRAVVATFYLYENQWDDFDRFYRSNKKGILKKEHLSSVKRGKRGGHAVMLTKISPNYLRLINSWGKEFADDGFFMVENSSVLNFEYYDVFFCLNDLKESEINAYNEYKRSGAAFIDKIPESVKSLPYKCPKCKEPSPVSQFIGHFQEATCPKCRETFVPMLLGFTMFN